MNTLSPDMTVGEIAARLPASIRIFEKHRIDFCCGGSVPISQACQTRGLDAAAMLDEIEQAASSGDDRAPGAAPDAHWQTATLGSLIDHIVEAHHGYLKSALPRLEALLEKVVARHSSRHGEVLRQLAATFHPLKEELDSHLMKEEMILFPLIRKLEMPEDAPASFHRGSIRNPIRVMVMEHDSAGGALAHLREVTSGYTPPDDACATWRALYFELGELERDLHRHIHLENNILFPRALKLE